MTVRKPRGNVSLAGLLLLASGVWGCVDVGSPLVIVQAQVPDTETSGSCLIPGERSEVRLFQGTLDVALDRPRPYYLFPLISNTLVKLGGGDKGNEPNRVDVTAMKVRIELPPGLEDVKWPAECPLSYDWAGPLTLFPAEENSTQVEALMSCHAQVIGGLFQTGRLDPSISKDIFVRAIVRAKGRHGGTEILSDPFEFPIRVCQGCLQTGYPDAQFAAFNFPNVPSCEALSANPFTGNPCNPAQDVQPVLCCAVGGDPTKIECPGIPRAPTPSSAP